MDEPVKHHVCPWWLGYFLSCPLRRFVENPEKLLGPYVRQGMVVVEPGCGMGFFSLPLARMVGPSGRVVCVDLQPRMITRLVKRAKKRGLLDRIEAVVCTENDLGLESHRETIDLAAAIHVVHEVPDASRFLTQIHNALKRSARLLILEPKGHVTLQEFNKTLDQARQAGFIELEPQTIRKEHAALLEKNSP